jgi:leucyl-tRNA synthetase
MELSNVFAKIDHLNEFAVKSLILLLAPITPHLSEELWSRYFDEDVSVFDQDWPEFDSSQIIDDEFEIAVQVNGKLRGNFNITSGTSKDDVLEMARNLDNVSKFLLNGILVKEIYIPNKIVNLVVKY